MSGFGFDYSQGFAGNQQQPNQPIRQVVMNIPRNFHNMNSGPVFEEQLVGNWAMDQADSIPQDVQNFNNINSGSAFHEQSVGNWQMDQAQPIMPMIPVMPEPHHSSHVANYGWQMPTAALGHTQSRMVVMAPAQSMQFDAMSNGQMQFDAMSNGQMQSGMINTGQMPTVQMQGTLNMVQAQNLNLSQEIGFAPQPTSTQIFSLQQQGIQNPSMQYPPSMQYTGMQQSPVMQQSPGMYTWGVQTPGTQTTHMRAIRQQSMPRSSSQNMQSGRNSGTGKRQLPRSPSVIDLEIKKLMERGKRREGDLAALTKLNSKITALRNERDKWFQADRMRNLKSEDEAARQSRRRSRETVDHLESSPAPKRQKRAGAEAEKLSPETSPGETRQKSTFSPDAAANKTTPATSIGESGRESTLSPAVAAVPKNPPGAGCIKPSAAAVPRTVSTPQRPPTNGLTLPPGAVFINPPAAVAAATTTPPEPIQQQSSTKGSMPPSGALCINPSDIALPRAVSVRQRSPTNRLALPPGAVYKNPSAAAAAAAAPASAATDAAAAATTTTIATAAATPASVATDAADAATAAAAAATPASAATAAAAEARADATEDDAQNAADFFMFAPLLQVINSPKYND